MTSLQTASLQATQAATLQPPQTPRAQSNSLPRISSQKQERILIIQYSGDYRATIKQFSENQGETYYAQKYSVELTASLGKVFQQVGLLSAVTDGHYDEVQTDGVRAMGLGIAGFEQNAKASYRAMIQMIETFAPTRLVVMTPMIPIVKWAIRHRIPTAALLADSFSSDHWRERLRFYRLVRLLNHPQIRWVGNHGINSTRQLGNLGVKPQKLLPWDWPAVITPAQFEPKQLTRASKHQTSQHQTSQHQASQHQASQHQASQHQASQHCTSQPLPPLTQPGQSRPEALNLLYVGSMIEDKGVADAIAAIAHLRQQQVPAYLRLAGAGDLDRFQAQIDQLGLGDWVKLLGLVRHDQVTALMQQADIVLVPSHHGYPEGLPMTIYEGLCTRTPLVVSDHPMFRGKLHHGVDAMVFPAQNSQALADCVQQLWQQPELYGQLSQNTERAWQNLQIPVKFGDVLHHWLSDPEAPAGKNAYLKAYTLANWQYP
jgi:glycosyltransferase involved in cell wall biosynthesis